MVNIHCTVLVFVIKLLAGLKNIIDLYPILSEIISTKLGILIFTKIVETTGLLNEAGLELNTLAAKCQSLKNNRVVLNVDGPILFFKKATLESGKSYQEMYDNIMDDEDFIQMQNSNIDDVTNNFKQEIYNIIRNFCYYNLKFDCIRIYFDGKSPEAKQYTKTMRRKKQSDNYRRNLILSNIKTIIERLKESEWVTIDVPVEIVNLEKGEAEMEMIRGRNPDDINIFYTVDSDVFLIGYGLANCFVYSNRKQEIYDLAMLKRRLQFPTFVFRLMFVFAGSDYVKNLFSANMTIYFLTFLMKIFQSNKKHHAFKGNQENLNKFKKEQLPVFKKYFECDNRPITKDDVVNFIKDLFYTVGKYKYVYKLELDIPRSKTCPLESSEEDYENFMYQIIWHMNYLEYGSDYENYNKQFIYVETIDKLNFIFKLIKPSFQLEDKDNLVNFIDKLYTKTFERSLITEKW